MLTRLLPILLCLALPVFAETEPVVLDAIPHAPAELVVAGPGGEQRYDPARLEAIGAHRMVTVTPWRQEEAVFDGVLLTDVLSANGMDDISAIRVVAENDYAVVIPADVWRRWPVLLATRVNGNPHSRRQRGPIQFVLPMSADPAAGTGNMTSSWVWMAARIEPVE